MDDIKILQELKKVKERIFTEMHKVIVGQDEIIEEILIGLFAGSHCLLIGVPGLAKTLMVRTLARILDLNFKRIQFTPDLMPSDIIGTEVIEEDKVSRSRSLRFIQGPIFANLILADEINRTPPKTQAALLEAMQEFNVTVGGVIHPLPFPFLVMATQNPIELEGTYPLPEAQLDRFMLSIVMDYPDELQEKEIVENTSTFPEADIQKIISGDKIKTYQSILKKIPVSDYIISYGVNLVRSTRPKTQESPEFVTNYVSWGAGPRATQHLILAAKTKAAMRGDVNVSVKDIRDVSNSVLRHRIFTNFNADAEGITSSQVLEYLLKQNNKLNDE